MAPPPAEGETRLEEMTERGCADVQLPVVDDAAALLRTLQGMGLHAAIAELPAHEDGRGVSGQG